MEKLENEKCTKPKGSFCTHTTAEIMQEINSKCDKTECEDHIEARTFKE